MQSDKKRVISNSLYYTLSNILLKVFSFLLIPLYTSFLTPDQYGIVNLSFGFSAFVSCLLMFGLQYAVVRFYADTKENQEGTKKLFSSVINFLLLSSTLVVLLLLVSESLWDSIILKNINSIAIVTISILISGTSGIYFVYQELLRGMQRAKESIILTYVYFFLMLLSNILVVVVFRLGALGILMSSLIVTIIMIGLMFRDLIHSGFYELKIDWKIIKSVLKYSLPLIPHTIAFNVSNLYTKIIINSKMTTSMLGLFSLASQFGMVADQVSNSVQSAFQPWLYQKLKAINEGENKEIESIRTLTSQLLWVFGAIYILIGAWAQQAIDIMTAPPYHSAWGYVPLIVMSVAIKSPLYFYQNFMYYYKDRSRYIFVCTIAGCTLSMILIWFLVPVIGIYGAIIADIIALVFRLFLTKWLLRRTNTIYSFTNVIAITLISIFWLSITVVPSYLGVFESQLWDYGYKTLLIIAYLSLIFWIYRAQAVMAVRNLFRKFA